MLQTSFFQKHYHSPEWSDYGAEGGAAAVGCSGSQAWSSALFADWAGPALDTRGRTGIDSPSLILIHMTAPGSIGHAVLWCSEEFEGFEEEGEWKCVSGEALLQTRLRVNNGDRCIALQTCR